jgi:hypothetical protein
VLEDCFHSKAESITSATNEKGGLGARRFEKNFGSRVPGRSIAPPGREDYFFFLALDFFAFFAFFAFLAIVSSQGFNG